MSQTKIMATWEVWHWPWWFGIGWKSWNTLGSWTTITGRWKFIQIQLESIKLWPGQWIWLGMESDLDLEDMTLGKGHITAHPLVMDSNCVKYPNPTRQLKVTAQTRILAMCALWPYPWRDVLSQGHITLWVIMVIKDQFSKTLSISNIAKDSYCPDKDYGYVCIGTLTLEIWPRFKVTTHLWVMDNNCVKQYPNQTSQKRVMTRTRIMALFTVRPWPWRYDLSSKSWHTLGSLTTIVWNIIHTQHDSSGLWRTRILAMCTLWHWPWRYDLGSRSWHTLRVRTTMVWNFIHIQHSSQELWQGQGF